MSSETYEWLNRNVLIGFTDQRGNAWHYRSAEQGGESNHYTTAIPLEDVGRRLFNWDVVEREMYVALDEGSAPVTTHKAITASDTDEILGVVGSDYRPHPYKAWLLDNVATLLDGDLAIGSAGLLKNRAVAWVEVTVPENIKTPEGVEFRPNLTAATSLDGSLATIYKRMVTAVVCDNTLAAGLRERSQQFRIRHTSRSDLRIAQAREALAIVYDTADEFSQEIARLCAHKVSDKEWDKLVEKLAPEKDGGGKRHLTTLNTKRFELDQLYRSDERCAPWTGTAFGALQAFNTYYHHVEPIRGNTVRVERNMRRALSGRVEQLDLRVLTALGVTA